MVMNEKLKKIIFRKLYEDLSGVEIIQHHDSIWFIDRDKKFWYLEYQNGGKLYWRYPFFGEFFNLFSMEMDVYEQVIVDWVEEVLNSKVITPRGSKSHSNDWVEEVLNCKVVTPGIDAALYDLRVEEVLNSKVVTPDMSQKNYEPMVGEVLNGNVVM
jgi:hypothetical protein